MLNDYERYVLGVFGSNSSNLNLQQNNDYNFKHNDRTNKSVGNNYFNFDDTCTKLNNGEN